MSRIGNKPITVPENVEVKIDGHHIEVKGPKGTITKQFNKDVIYALENEDLEKLAMYYEDSKLYCKQMTDYTKINKLINWRNKA